MAFMKTMPDNSVDMTLTDVPFGVVNRESGNFRNLDKGVADIETFDLTEFISEVHRVTRGAIFVFCAVEQISTLADFLTKKNGSFRPFIWHKTNPSPMNGEYIYLPSFEIGVWFKKRGWKTFNAFCKHNVFETPTNQNTIHPTEKNHDLLAEMILDNTNKGDIVFDPCAGSGSSLYVAKNYERRFLGCELHKPYFDAAHKRLFQTTVDL